MFAVSVIENMLSGIADLSMGMEGSQLVLATGHWETARPVAGLRSSLTVSCPGLEPTGREVARPALPGGTGL